ncbi:MAG: amidohydrolase family protein [Candidatus Hydrogenedentes bacterium]|nr:amidohydrolase family protein [Candidatus Hydrogenedentota bacterium]
MLFAAMVLVSTVEAEEDAPVLVLRGAAVFDSVRGEMLPNQIVIVRGERIESVGANLSDAVIPPKADIVDATGNFIIPGMIDAHAHLQHQLNLAHMTGEEVLPLYLACGVTSLREVGDQVSVQKLILNYAEAHPESCPRIFMCSPLIDGSQPFHQDVGWDLSDPEKVPAFVEDMKAWGVTTLKIYVGTQQPVGKRVIEEAHKHGLVVTGHLGLYHAQYAVHDGIDCLEHIWSVFDYIIPDGPRPDGYRSVMDLTTPKAKDLIASIKEHNTAVDPTLTIFRNALLLTDLEAVYTNPDLAYVPARLRKRWESHRANQGLKPETFDLRRKEFEKYQELTGILYREGVTILAGTDTAEPYVIPGFSMHEELERLVESGLPASAALQSATIRNATALKQEANLGSISPGKLADIVVLTADPLTDICNSRKIDKVIRGGIVCDPQTLLKMVPPE